MEMEMETQRQVATNKLQTHQTESACADARMDSTVENANTIDNAATDGDDHHRDDEDEEESSISMTLCQECSKIKAIYACPRCEVRTCSLQCCVGHKARTGCTGKRDRTSFRQLNRMDDSTMRSDYFFLEDVLNQVSRTKRRRPNSVDEAAPVRHRNSKQNRSNQKWRRFCQKASERGITVQLLPPFMTRHIANKSWCKGKTDVITWTVEFIVDCSSDTAGEIAHAEPTDGTAQQYQLQQKPKQKQKQRTVQVSEDEPDLNAVVRSLLKGEDEVEHPSKDAPSSMMDSTSDNANETTCNKQYHFFVRKIPSPANEPEYDEIKGSLRTGLSGKTIMEYPTIYCVFEPNLSQYRKRSKVVMLEELEVAEDAADGTSTKDSAMVADPSESCPA